MKFIVVQRGSKGRVRGYRKAIALYERAVRRMPGRMAGVFPFGSESSLFWHFGDGRAT